MGVSIGPAAIVPATRPPIAAETENIPQMMPSYSIVGLIAGWSPT
jgi:hypothetical protein